MNKDEVIRILKIERECISRDCNRDCGQCDLVQDRDYLLKVYDSAIVDLEKLAHPTGAYALARAIDEMLECED